jgi:hypothetical protein
MTEALPIDPRGLIREAYRIDQITDAECRSIFLDWAIGVEETCPEHLRALLDHYGPAHPGHPMTAVLEEGLNGPPAAPSRRGGASARRTTDE